MSRSRRSHKHNMGPKGRIDILSPLLSIREIAAGRRLMGPFHMRSIALSLPMVLQSGFPTPWCMPNTAFNLCHPPFPSLFPAKNSWLGVGGGGGFLPHGSLESCCYPFPFPNCGGGGGGAEKKSVTKKSCCEACCTFSSKDFFLFSNLNLGTFKGIFSL